MISVKKNKKDFILPNKFLNCFVVAVNTENLAWVVNIDIILICIKSNLRQKHYLI